jgi:hypothetical protein
LSTSIESPTNSCILAFAGLHILLYSLPLKKKQNPMDSAFEYI